MTNYEENDGEFKTIKTLVLELEINKYFRAKI